MQTVVLGWFGFSAVWFIPLFWRLVKAMLPGGSGLAGPGSIRLWLGFVCVLAASCTLAAALPGDATTNAFGHALAGGFEHVLGRIGTPLAMIALFFVGLPWLLDVSWRQASAWLDASLGIRLTREHGADEPRSAAELPRTAPHRDDGRADMQPMSAHTVNSMAPRQNGRYARPTPWKPSDAPHERRAQAAGARAAAQTAAPVGWPKPGTAARGAAAAGAASAIASGHLAVAKSAGRMSSAGLPATEIRPPALTNGPGEPAMIGSPGGAPSTPAMPNPPFASGPARRASPAGSAQSVTAAARGPFATRSATAEQRFAPRRSPAQAAVAAARNRPMTFTPSRQAAAAPRNTLATPRPSTARSSVKPAAVEAARKRPVNPARAPLYAWSEKPAQPIEPAPSVHETLRSIEASAAQWAALAGAPSSAAREATRELAAPASASASAPAAAAAAAAETAPASPSAATSATATNASEAIGTVAAVTADSASNTGAAGQTDIERPRGGGVDASAASPAASACDAVAGMPPAATTESGAPIDDAAGIVPTDASAGIVAHAQADAQTQASVETETEIEAETGTDHSTVSEAAAVAQAAVGERSDKPAGEPTPTAIRATGSAAGATAAPLASSAAATAAGAPRQTLRQFSDVAAPGAIGPNAGAHAAPDEAGTAASAGETDAHAERAAIDADTAGHGALAAQARASTGGLVTQIIAEHSLPTRDGIAIRAPASAQADASLMQPPGNDARTSWAAASASMPGIAVPVSNLASSTAPSAAAERAHGDPVPTAAAPAASTAQAAAPAQAPPHAPAAPAASVAQAVSATAPIAPAAAVVPALSAASAPRPASAPATVTIATAQAMPATTPPLPAASSPLIAPAHSAGSANLAASATPVVSAPVAAEAMPVAATPADAPATEPARPARQPAPNAFEFHAPAASNVELPTLELLEPASDDVETISDAHLAQTGQVIEQRLQEFKVPVTVVGASAGPVITRFEIEPALGVRGSQIVGLMKDLSRGLGLTSIRVVETIPGKTCMGLELPNAKRQMIRLSEILASRQYQHSASHLTLAMGKDITGNPVVTDLAKAPHMLVAGTTGSGKSVAVNAMIASLLYKATPEEVRLIMIDPKMLELSVYEGIPHLLAPVVTDMKLAANALNWCVGEMEKRYRLMSAVGVRNLAGFNQKIRDAAAKEKKIGNPFSLTPDDPEPLAPLPLIVVVIDELADLMMVAGKKIEELIARLAQKARAAGIHLILATQRPSVDVITGLIKANIPTRVAFQVSSKIDSRTILDQMGAESLLGQGDMLFLPPGTGYPQRVHGAFVADEEVHRIVEYLKQFGEPQYEEGILDGPAAEGGGAQDLFGEAPDAEADPLYDEAVAFVVRTRRASISSVQRQLRIGYNRAARLVEQMEAAGLVSSMGINGSREVLAPPLPE
ncbi:FtsK/SpoIIIE family DNA translocase [Burkholderia sp. TSV86]|uniref:FtsK/SpoIIIE family DNA translocase n=1 Tax=Burkholderia sp. TSV86 TaxID=1385594 RepID=UPI000755A52B|nr:DNA translocase FtsK [Burkholderia sp. TSV86]KVE39236.1 hypothetical protein WS68_20785 [Burkholderia sp. TSV86]